MGLSLGSTEPLVLAHLLLSHQIGGFLGACLGGLSITLKGDDTWMWYADIVLAAFGALVNLRIREAPVARAAVPA